MNGGENAQMYTELLTPSILLGNRENRSYPFTVDDMYNAFEGRQP